MVTLWRKTYQRYSLGLNELARLDALKSITAEIDYNLDGFVGEPMTEGNRLAMMTIVHDILNQAVARGQIVNYHVSKISEKPAGVLNMDFEVTDMFGSVAHLGMGRIGIPDHDERTKREMIKEMNEISSFLVSGVDYE